MHPSGALEMISSGLVESGAPPGQLGLYLARFYRQHKRWWCTSEGY